MATHRLGVTWRRVAAALAHTAFASFAAGGTPALAAQDALVVLLDRAKVAKLPPKAQTLIVGNPIIADVTLVKDSNVMVITGKGYGETNLVVLDKNGALLTEEFIRVKANERALLVVQRGLERESYSCAPRCEPTVQLGDAGHFAADAGGQITARNGLATSAAH